MIIQRQDIGFSSAAFRWTPRGQGHLELLVELLEEGNRQAVWLSGCLVVWLIESLYETAIFIEKGMLGIMDDLVLAEKLLVGVHKTLKPTVRSTIVL